MNRYDYVMDVSSCCSMHDLTSVISSPVAP